MTYYLIGIKGAGLAALAIILKEMNYHVLGSDITDEIFIEHSLKAKGITILPFSVDNLRPDYKVIVGNAFRHGHIELTRAQEMGLEIYYYNDFIEYLSKDYVSIAISGSHGKTTTTKMIKTVFEQQRKITYLVGDGVGGHKENSSHFVYEACEYRDNFLSFYPDYSVITNIDLDHVDYFEDLESYKKSFNKFAENTRKKVVVFGDDVNTEFLTGKKIFKYGVSNENDLVAKNICLDDRGMSFDVYIKYEFYQSYNLPLYGYHNLYNVLAAISVAYLEKLDKDEVSYSLKYFKNANRRFNIIEHDSQIIIDDYAHHPNEITSTIQAVKQKYPNKEIVAIFQPHTYTRLEAFLKETAEALNTVDYQYVCEVFSSVREHEGNVSKSDLLKLLDDGVILDVDNVTILKKHKDSVLLFMGAGDIYLKYMNKYLTT